MRLNEIVSAEQQLALWRLINGSVWQALNRHANTERTAKLNPIAVKPSPLPKPKQQTSSSHKAPQPFNKPPRSKRKLAAIKPQSTR
ncbi:hypothetical protein EDE11_1398 [Methylomonas methanica]|uniref:Uncharacterized protein n=2 Tax=Methylomonas TaxID=416 RepID=A0A126T479_9GAMM|nr:hypothetical protein JT25_010380 [Methylomonas denitrificans]OAI09143.1 hypothetical protein A1342_19800 [Methylomonas methanica]TCV74194.1 hypothetical protein EDE11_1398 [Methylomonas methanica]